MGYDVHITRKTNWWDDWGPEISADEWHSFVSADAQMSITGVAECRNPDGEVLRIESPLLTQWRGHPDGLEVWISYFKGSFSIKNPDDACLAKMDQIAHLLKAKVQGDEGELYINGQAVPSSQTADVEFPGTDKSPTQSFVLLPGSITSTDYEGPGDLLLTNRSAFVLRPSMIRRLPRPSLLAHIFGGWAAVVSDLSESRLSAPDFFSDPEIAQLPKRTQEKLFDLSLIAKTPLNERAFLRRLDRSIELEIPESGRILVKFGWRFKKLDRFLTETSHRIRGV